MNEESASSRPKKRRFVDLALPFRLIAGALFAAILLVTISQIFFRFIINDPLIWSDEIARFFLIWMTFIGAAVVAWDGRHLSVDVFFSSLPLRARIWVRRFNYLVTCSLLAVIAWTGIPMVEIEMFSEIGALQIKGGYFRLPAVVCSILIVAALIARIAYRLPRDPDDNSAL